MVYLVRLKPKAEKEIGRLPRPDQLRIYIAIQDIAKDPRIGKKLKGEYEGFYSLRVWPYRIIYTVYKKELLVIVVRVGHRQGVY